MRPIGANTWIWTAPLTDAGLQELFPRVAGMGFDVIELPLEEPGAWDAGLAAELAAEHSLGVSVCAVMPPGRELAGAETAAVRATQEYVRECIGVAARLGSHAVAGPLYTSVGRCWRMDPGERRALVAQLRESLAPLADEAADAGVHLALEPLNRYETSFLNTVEQALEAIDGLPAGGCGLLLDTYHLNIEERDPAAAIRSAGDRLAHVHASASDRGAPGADHLDWPALLDAVDATGYDGPMCIESFTAENDVIATAASVWRPLARSQDAIAQDGLAFLRSLSG